MAVSAKVPASSCNIPAPPADAAPAIQSCLKANGVVEFSGGQYLLKTTLSLDNWQGLVSTTTQTVLRGDEGLQGPMIRVDGKVNTRISGFQLVLPTSAAGANAVIEFNNSASDNLYNVIEDNFIVEEHVQTVVPAKAGILMRSNTTGVAAMYYNIVQRNRVFNFKHAIQLEADNLQAGSNPAPVSGNWFINNVTSGVVNILCKAGCQQNFFSNHFCNGFLVPSRQVCLAGGTLDAAPGANVLGVAAENVFSGKIDMGPDQDPQNPNAAYILAANATRFMIQADDGQGDTSVDRGFENTINVQRRERREFFGKAASISVGKALDSLLMGGLTGRGQSYICNVDGNYAAIEVIPGGVGAGVRVLRGTGCVKGEAIVPAIVSLW